MLLFFYGLQVDGNEDILTPLDSATSYFTEPMAFNITTGGNIEIIKVEKFHGNMPNWQIFQKTHKINCIPYGKKKTTE